MQVADVRVRIQAVHEMAVRLRRRFEEILGASDSSRIEETAFLVLGIVQVLGISIHEAMKCLYHRNVLSSTEKVPEELRERATRTMDHILMLNQSLQPLQLNKRFEVAAEILRNLIRGGGIPRKHLWTVSNGLPYEDMKN